MRQYNHSAQDIQLTFSDMVESFKMSSRYQALSEGSKQEYKRPIERLLGMGSKLVIGNPMQMPVAVARSRSHKDFWETKIMAADVTPYEKARLVLFLKMLYRAMGLGDLVETVKLPKDMRHERGDANPLTKEKVFRILEIEKPELRTYAKFLAFLFYTGMRPSEAMALKWTEVSEKYITVMGSKGRVKGIPSRMVPVLPELVEIIAYCKSLGSDWVFVSALRRPLNKFTVCEKRQEIFNLCGIKGVTYDARRGLATSMFRAKYQMREIADILGHKDTRTTEAYIRLTMEEKAANFKGV
jgi:integrase